MQVVIIAAAIVVLGVSALAVTGFIVGAAMAAVGKLREWQQRQVARGAGLESPGEATREE